MPREPRQSRLPAILGSVLVHALVIGAFFIALPKRPSTLVQGAVPVTIVSSVTQLAAPADNPQPEAEVAPEAELTETPEPEPTPAPPTPSQTRPTPPQPRPTPPQPNPAQKGPQRPQTPPRPNPSPPRDQPSLDLDAIASGPSRPGPRRPQRPPVGDQGQGRAPVATGPQLADLAGQVPPNWLLNCDLAGIEDLTIRVRVGLADNGRITSGPTVLNRRSDPVWRAAAESAERAIRATAPFTVPDDFAAQEITFRFELRDVCRGR
ncbi:hypothetical protein Q0812_09070 [Brevundimonas sp. 2R-24]|uniref:Uncharacterized protein n=1 Tax=Peiella sedimenti TaxID=3061083 RepID=A0ABT8SMJ4_9CAUL|nr:hypothetical protein [Caulobacteraceae bacterium XZ-24]